MADDETAEQQIERHLKERYMLIPKNTWWARVIAGTILAGTAMGMTYVIASDNAETIAGIEIAKRGTENAIAKFKKAAADAKKDASDIAVLLKGSVNAVNNLTATMEDLGASMDSSATLANLLEDVKAMRTEMETASAPLLISIPDGSIYFRSGDIFIFGKDHLKDGESEVQIISNSKAGELYLQALGRVPEKVNGEPEATLVLGDKFDTDITVKLVMDQKYRILSNKIQGAEVEIRGARILNLWPAR